jgi:hypothetical protein
MRFTFPLAALSLALLLAACQTGADGSRGPVTGRLQALFFDVVAGKAPAYQSWLTPV